MYSLLYRQLRVRSEVLWYMLWSTLLVISAGNALFPYPVFSSNPGVIFSYSLAAVAGIQLMYGNQLRSQRHVGLGAVLLLTFGVAQFGWWLRTFVTLSKDSLSAYRGADFSAYYLAAKILKTPSAEGLYTLPLYADGRMNFLVRAPVHSALTSAALEFHVPVAATYIYPPFLAVLMQPMTRLSFASAYFVWDILTIALVIGGVLLAIRVAGGQMDRKLGLLVGVGLFSYFPLYQCLYEGQVSGLILFLTTLGVWLLSRNYSSLSALSFAVATMIKLTPILAVPVLIIHRKWKWLTAYGAWMGALLALSIWQAGWPLHQQFWTEVLPRLSCGAPVDQNISLVAYVQKLFLGYVPVAPGAPLSLPKYACGLSRLIAIVVYVMMLFRFYCKRNDKDVVRDLVLMAMLMLVVSPITWTHYGLIALLPFVYLWCRVPQKGNRVLLLLFIAIGSNVIGYALLIAVDPALQLILAGIVPCLMIAVVYSGEISTRWHRSSTSPDTFL